MHQLHRLAPLPRVRQIYGTARRGAIDIALAGQLWVSKLQPVYGALAGLPVVQHAYDDYVVEMSLQIEADLTAAGRGGFGIAQKIVNLFMKDLWAFGLIPAAIEPHLHVPIDRGVLNRLNIVPVTWNPWTAAFAGAAGAPTVADYLQIQNQYRGFLAPPAAPDPHPPLFATRIEMEQFLWHGLH